jgi:hypothetical protein
MDAGGASARELLEREAEAWRSLSPSEYDRAMCGMLEEIGAASPSAEGIKALLSLASATLRRTGPPITESRACFAEHLLALGSMVSEPTQRSYLRLLFLLAWLQLAAVAERGPEAITVAPPLPPGAAMPDGVDPAAIADPVLRQQALEATTRHRQEAERWNAKQRALGHLRRIATLARASCYAFGDDKEAGRDLAAAMSLAPGVPPELRCVLVNDAE